MAEGASRRFQGATSGERVTQATILSTDCIQLRHDIGGDADTDKGIQLSQLKPQYVGYCATAAGTVDKVITVQNFNDFKLVNGMQITVYFKNANTAATPTFNVNSTGKKTAVLQNQKSTVSIGTGCWGAGTWLTLQYCKITTDSSSTVERWVIIGHDIAQQSLASSSGYTISASGRCEQYITLSPSSRAVNTSWGNLYESSYFTLSLPKTLSTVTYDNVGIATTSAALVGIERGSGTSNRFYFISPKVIDVVTATVTRTQIGYI